MVKINVQLPFTLTHGGLKIPFAAGLHEVEEEIAGHWYVKAHSSALEAEPVTGGGDKLPGGDDDKLPGGDDDKLSEGEEKPRASNGKGAK